MNYGFSFVAYFLLLLTYVVFSSLTATMSKLDRTCYISLVIIHQMCHTYSDFMDF